MVKKHRLTTFSSLILAAYTDETQELTKEGDISFFQKELEASGFTEFIFE